jgi:protein associated with RNAse G/E
MAIDYNELEQKLKEMQPRQRLYEMVKKEVTRRGHWKNSPRGKVTPGNLARNK